MKPRIGIVGTRELVESVVGFRHAVPHADLVDLAYEDDSECVTLMRAHDNTVDAWLFTDPQVHHASTSLTNRPTAYLEYSGSALLVAVVRLLSQGEPVTHLSIDSMSQSAVQEVLSEAGIPTAEIRVFNPGPTGTSEEIAEFHLGFIERGYTAVTCVTAVHDALRSRMPTVRLTPSGDVIRTALTELALTTTNQVSKDSQLVVGFLRPGTVRLGTPELSRIESSLGAFITKPDENTFLVVTTRRGILRATGDLSVSPFQGLGAWTQRIHAGFGMGQTAPEAAQLAKHALQRAEGHAAPATVISPRRDSDILLKETTPTIAQVVEVPSVGVVAAHSGLSSANVLRLQKVARSAPGEAHTTRDIADALGIEMRTARRLMQRLEHSGYAERVGQQTAAVVGRPLTLYRIAL